MHYYKTLDTESGFALRDILQSLRTEGEACELAAQEFAKDLGAESYVPSLDSDYGGLSALSFAPDKVHLALFDPAHILRPLLDDNGSPITSSNGTPYFTLNFDFHDQPTRYQRAQRMRRRTDCIISQGKLRLSAVINAMSRTDIIKEGLGRKPKFTNEFQILKFRYKHALSEAKQSGRESEQQWLKDYSELRTAADFRRVFTDITAGESQQLEKSRAELREAIDALEDTEWSIVVEILPGERCTDHSRIYELARRQYFLPVIHFGDTHRLLGATPNSDTHSRPSTFVCGDTCYVMLEEEATAEGLVSISVDEYRSAVETITDNR